MEETKGNPIRWVTPEFPTLGKYEYDDEIAWSIGKYIFLVN